MIKAIKHEIAPLRSSKRRTMGKPQRHPRGPQTRWKMAILHPTPRPHARLTAASSGAAPSQTASERRVPARQEQKVKQAVESTLEPHTAHGRAARGSEARRTGAADRYVGHERATLLEARACRDRRGREGFANQRRRRWEREQITQGQVGADEVACVGGEVRWSRA